MLRSHLRNATLIIAALTLACGGQEPLSGDVDAAQILSSSWPAMGTLPAACSKQQPLVTFFAPNDPTVTLELSLIDEVRAARKAAGAAAGGAEGKNPHRIRYAVYNLTNKLVMDRLF